MLLSPCLSLGLQQPLFLGHPCPRKPPDAEERRPGYGDGAEAGRAQLSTPPPTQPAPLLLQSHFNLMLLTGCKALHLPDVPQGQLLTPFINYSGGGIPLFLKKQQQKRTSSGYLVCRCSCRGGGGGAEPWAVGQSWEGFLGSR